MRKLKENLKLKQRVLVQRNLLVNNLAAAEVEVAEVGGVDRRPGLSNKRPGFPGAEDRLRCIPGGQSNTPIMFDRRAWLL